uniref:MORN repeat-containing protein 4 n=1 Tax=Arion vulgaris TaxID=1028688 RepID=A0A0B7AWY2_9EUPU
MSTQQGQYRYPDGSVYHGQWDSDGRRHGYGSLILSDGSKFRGNFDKGFYSELGAIDFTDGSKYEGEFLKGRFHGLGVFVQSNNMRFEGEFKDGKICGLGIVSFPNGSHGLPRNEGYFDGMKIVRQEQCPRVIQRARDVATRVRALNL